MIINVKYRLRKAMKSLNRVTSEMFEISYRCAISKRYGYR